MANQTINMQNGVSPITIDTKVTEGSTRPVMGGGIYEALMSVAEPFVVNVTPTTLDFTAGTMDKTVGEIYVAWLEGRRILFVATVAGMGTASWGLTSVGFIEGQTYPSFNSTMVEDTRGEGELMYFITGTTDDATSNTWAATYYALTPNA